MQEKLQLLRDMQELDLELSEIRANRNKLETEQAALQEDIDRIRTMVEDLTGEMEILQGERVELTQALSQEEENVQRAEGRLPTIKTQKEYVAVLKEIDTAKKMNKDIQDQIAAKENEIASLGKDKEEKEAELANLTAQVSTRQEEIGQALSECGEALESKQGQRNQLLEQLPVPLRKRYQLLLDRRAGLAVVEARGGACLGCHMHLPPQLFNSLYRVETIESCPHCNRMIYIAEETV